MEAAPRRSPPVAPAAQGAFGRTIAAMSNAKGAIKRVAWIGTGVMGLPMVGHLLDRGYELTVFSRTKAKTDPLVERGARWAGSAAEAASGADVAITMVGFPRDVREMHLGERGTLSADPLPRYIIDMTTSEPTLAVQIAQAARALGVGSIDAPVSGGDVGARNATLAIMVGAESDDFDAVKPIFDALGGNVIRQGGPGAGQHTKMVNQILIAANMIGVCEGLLYARAAGLDPHEVIRSVSAGAAGSWSISNLGPRIVKRDFDPGFYVEHFIKDLEIALAEAARLRLSLPGLALARQLYEAVRAHGHGRSGTQALMIALEALSGVRAEDR
jgi:3-hydroxyisobutyrate dehydrogenase